nr:helix-turn-helix domain-containing protein [Dysgonomonas sp. Marseille-P4677]
MLHISPRTLQTYRDTGRISFSRINHKIYYRVSDIEKFLQSGK